MEDLAGSQLSLEAGQGSCGDVEGVCESRCCHLLCIVEDCEEDDVRILFFSRKCRERAEIWDNVGFVHIRNI